MLLCIIIQYVVMCECTTHASLTRLYLYLLSSIASVFCHGLVLNLHQYRYHRYLAFIRQSGRCLETVTTTTTGFTRLGELLRSARSDVLRKDMHKGVGGGAGGGGAGGGAPGGLVAAWPTHLDPVPGKEGGQVVGETGQALAAQSSQPASMGHPGGGGLPRGVFQTCLDRPSRCR